MPGYTTGELSINYEDTIARAGELDDIGTSCEQVASSVDKLIAVLESSWKGESGQEAMNLVNNWKSREADLASKMHTVADQIRMVANSIKDADESAANRNRG